MGQLVEPDWQPHRPVVLIAGTPPGGGQDRAARALAASLGDLLDVPIEIVNVPGRGGGNGWDLLAETPGDAHHLSISSPTLITNRLMGAATLDHRGLTAVAMLCTEYIAFVVAAGSSIVNVDGFLDRLVSPDPTLVIALATAVGNVNHVALGQIAAHAGAVPSTLAIRVFDSAPEAVRDLLEGRSEVAAVTAASVIPALESGSVKALAVSAPARLRAPFDQVPGWVELAVPCNIGTWRGVVAPPGLDQSQIDFWERSIASVVTRADWSQALGRHHWSPTHLDAEATQSFHGAQAEFMREALAGLGLLGGNRG